MADAKNVRKNRTPINNKELVLQNSNFAIFSKCCQKMDANLAAAALLFLYDAKTSKAVFPNPFWFAAPLHGYEDIWPHP